MIVRQLVFWILSGLAFSASADVPHFVSESEIQVDATGWKISAPRYVIGTKLYKIAQWTPADELPNHVCTAFGYKSLRDADITMSSSGPIDYVTFGVDGMVSAVEDGRYVSDNSLFLLDSLICVK